MSVALLRYGTYPLVMGFSIAAILWMAAQWEWAWLGFTATAVSALAVIATLERVIPYQRVWQLDHGDFAADIVHAAVNFGLLGGSAFALHAIGLDVASVWPYRWPLWAQILLAGAVMDLGLYLMHRASHRVGPLWRLHAIHHAPERLYWLNGERRHPLSALVLASPGLVAVVALGAPPLVVSAWLTLLAIHLGFQHANVDYRVGPLRYVLGVAEIHRWHHKREYEDAQVNFGEFWMIWDHLGRTFHDQPNGVIAGEVGLRDQRVPDDYGGQLRWPFTQRDARSAVSPP